ncbi:LysR family transcriptional regulator [Alicyclobacillus sp. SO9]|uniref:LysR family transcriptional regulator n=1 Tax=Alicyclobacillus sp. SO9 TaxID=2665646 RepID=UPI001E34829E|nr:LysR family transcriptional regulator [Alicyclobacillus sp. SO9]
MEMDHKLMAFLAVARHGNFSRAAEELHMSQPAVSQQVQSLEHELQVKLFERNTKRVSLTGAGKIVQHYGGEIETAYGAMQRMLDDLTNVVAGELVIGASYTFGEYVLPYAVAEFCKFYPDVRPSIQISNTIHVANMLLEDAIDVGIVEGEIEEAGLVTDELMTDKMVIIAAPSHAPATDPAMLKRLQAETWILREPGSGTRAAADKVLESLGIEVKSKMEFGSTQAIKESVQAGLGISVLSELAIKKELAQEALKALFYPGQADRPFYLLRRRSAFEPKVAEMFREFLAEYVRIHFAPTPASDS